MKAAILSVGTELLFGQITNTNAVYISQKLNALGFDVMYQYTVGDNPGRLEKTIETALTDCDLIISSGGLGPTEDDLTKDIFCKVFKDKLVYHQESLDHLNEIAEKRHRKMTENNFEQALVPSRACVFYNHFGSAPGFALENQGKYCICMPGPPREMIPMWEKSVEPYLEQFQSEPIVYKTLCFFGIGESLLETKLLPLIDAQTDPTIATYAKSTYCQVRVASKRASKEEAYKAIDETVEKIEELVGEFIYSYEDEELNQVLGRKLLEKRISLSACESCTGGMFASKMVEVPGISAVFDRSLVTYSYDAKMAELGVKAETLAKYTAESEEVALEMVRGIKEVSGSRLCVSVTGVAGPEPMGNRPAGLIFIGIIFDNIEKVVKINTGSSDRYKNRLYATMTMMNELNKLVDAYEE